MTASDEASATARELGGRARKSDAAFRTISEVAEELDIAQHVLRFWESKFPQVRPLKRGGGRRYYRPEDIETLRQIRRLLYDQGYTIKGAQKLLRGTRARGPTANGESRRSDITPPTTNLRISARNLSGDTRRRLEVVLTELEETREALRRALL